jgi:hypothetical protein
LAKAKTPLPSPAWKEHGPWLAALAILVIAVLGSPLFSSQIVLSDRNTDLSAQFLYARAFGFGELQRGHLPLWNPYIYGGVPFVGDFQAALFYPPNLLFLVLPLATAINWSFAIHLFLLAGAMYFWASTRGLRPAAAFVAGTAATFSGTVLLHIYAGHLSNICSIAWIPLIFSGIDGWLRRRHAGWLMLASAAAALQIYAGHPQYVYFTALVAGLYSLVHLPGTPRLLSAVLGLAAIYPVAALLSAAQLLPGIAATSEAVRSGGVSYDFAAMFSFPPENFLTALTPWIFGDMRATPYWGRCYLWEMSIYSGVGMLLLATFGMGRQQENGGRWRLLILLAGVIILALGAHTPIHKLLYNILPGFSSFRGSSKFITLAALIISLFAGIGMDRLLKRAKVPLALGIAAGAIGLALFFSAFLISESTVKHFAGLVAATKESYFPPAAFDQYPQILASAKALAAQSLQISGGLLIFFAAALLAANRWSKVSLALGAAAVAEIFVFARGTVTTFPLADFTFQPVAEFLQKTPGDFRTLNLVSPDSGMLLRSENVWGYDPTVLKRYAQLLFVSQGLDPATANQNLSFSSNHPILEMLRCRFAFQPKAGGQLEAVPLNEPFLRFALYSKYRVMPDSEATLRELKSPFLDLRREVLLESEPVPKPDPETPKAEINVIDSSTDHWTISVKTDRATILVMTDAYSKDWHATGLPGSAQLEYKVMPANHAIRAIPLSSGEHRIRISYSPGGLGTGIAITLGTLLVFGVAGFWSPIRRKLDFLPSKA